MPDNLNDLLNKDRDALAYFQSLPLFVRDRVMSLASHVKTKEELSGIANNFERDALMLNQYRPMFEDETDSDIDLQ